jgi:predicted secreted protein
MGWFTGIVLYVLIWWVALFAVLPIGTHAVSEADPASGWRGAPAAVHLPRKLLATTLVAAVIWLGFYAVITSSWLSFRTGWLALPND